MCSGICYCGFDDYELSTSRTGVGKGMKASESSADDYEESAPRTGDANGKFYYWH